MAKILPILLLLAFVAYGQSTDALRKFGKSYAKCCCSEEAVGNKDCENILRNVIVPRAFLTTEEFQEEVKDFLGIQSLCAIIETIFACNGCAGFTCPGEKRDCSVSSVGTRYHDLEDLDDD
ncbi:MAG: hypothetical protein FWC15_08650 [Fibromonadales bacterium]|nr:hypothetical protein [Fibromonadales bacterium]